MSRNTRQPWRPSSRRSLALFAAAAILAPFAAVAAHAAPVAAPTKPADHSAHDHHHHHHAVGGGVPADEPDRGMVYQGLELATDGSCGRALRVQGTDLCTHGPDPAPPGADLRQSPQPVTHARSAAGATPNGIVFCGNGGPQVEVIYAVSSDRLDRYDTFLDSIRQWADDADEIYRRSAAETGGTSNIYFLRTAACEIVVSHAVITPAGDDTFAATIGDLQDLGYDNDNRKYVIYADANVYCGIGTFYNDDSPGAANNNNDGPSYGRTDTACWGANTPSHELMHNLGGVQDSAPHSTGGGHCTDESDRMCYDDGPAVLTFPCPSIQETRLDCNHDDYFSTSPRAGSYLDTHWNAANSDWLFQGPQGTWGYVWANQPAAAAYTPSASYQYNSIGGSNTITRSAAGVYEVTMPGLGTASGTVNVTAYGAGTNNCKVVNWTASVGDELINVRCYTNAGVLSDTMFTAHFVTAVPSMQPMGYVWANLPASDSYLPSANYQFNSTGADNTIDRLDTGEYRVDLPGLGAGGGHVMVTAYGLGSNTCKATSWSQLLDMMRVFVACHATNGAAVDTMFTATFVNDTTLAGLTGWPAGNVWANDATSDSYTPSPIYQFNSAGGINTIDRTGVGAYTVTMPDIGVAGGHVEVVAYGGDSNECKVSSWGAFGADERVFVRCYTTGGVAVDTRFNASFSAMAWT